MGDAVLDDATIEFLTSGCALIVATVAPDGEPHATRGWGLDVVPGEGLRARLLLASDDAVTLAHVAEGGRIAITAADVRTLRSIQMKGRALGLATTTGDEETRARRYLDRFFTDIEETDGTPRAVLERLVPVGYTPCLVAIDELYDQTPGPRAGQRLDRAVR